MIYESDRNMPLGKPRNSYPWANDRPSQQQACLAIQMGDIELLRRALAQGADLHHPIRPLLVEAAQRGQVTLAEYLLHRWVQVNFQNSLGETAILFAAQTGNLRMLRLLASYGGDIHLRDRFGTTPLMQATFHGHLDAIAFLVERGADCNARNQDGLSVLGHARQGRAAWDWKRKRGLRAERDRTPNAIYSSEEVARHLEQDFECLKSLDEQYRRIQTYLASHGATNCKTPVRLLTLPKQAPTKITA